MTRILGTCLTALACLSAAYGASAQTAEPTPPKPPATDDRPGLWIVAGGGGMLARAHCGSCNRAGVFHYSAGALVDGGIRISPRVDAGIEVAWVTTRVEELEPIRTTFVMGVGQFRPWVDRGLSLRGGMGMGFVGNGLLNPLYKVKPPYSTNALAVVLGIGWEFLRDERFTFQILCTQHVAAVGELETEDGSIKNVVGNYWLVGGMLVIR